MFILGIVTATVCIFVATALGAAIYASGFRDGRKSVDIS